MSTSSTPLTGPIAWMARNSVAANLLMAIVIIGGLFSLLRLKQEIFPEFDLDVITVAVPYPGASPEEVEQGIALAVEEAVRGVDGVKRVTSSSSENAGVVSIELLIDADGDKVLADIKSAVDRITTFPEDAEEPNVTLVSQRARVVSILLAGDQDLSTLHAIAEEARLDLLAHPDITQIELKGTPSLEVSIEVPRETLRAHGWTLDDIAMQIRAASLELPGGAIDTDAGEVLVRLSDRRRSGHEFEDIILTGTAGGAKVRLGDVATITDGFAEAELASYLDGAPAIELIAYRVGAETPKRVATAVRDYAEELRAELPEGMVVQVWDDDSVMLQGRIDLLVRNAVMGLFLVVIVLALFLDLKLAFWVAVGIPVSFTGAFLLMPAGDVSINMISLFGLIVTLGMVVDDAIIVGENAYEKLQHGMEPTKAAITGAQEMAMPVTFAILTTIAAFSPMFFVPGVMGKIFRILPAVVLMVLVFSLIESFFILPAHLAHISQKKSWLMTQLDRPRALVTRGLDFAVRTSYRPAMQLGIRYRYITGSVAVALMFGAIGTIASGLLPFNFFPNLESDLVTVSAQLPYGTPIEKTNEVRRILEASAEKTMAEIDQPDAFIGMYTRVGEAPNTGHRFSAGEGGSHLLSIELQMVTSDDRDFSAESVTSAWERNTPEIAGVDALKFISTFGPGSGAAVDVQLSHADTDVLAAASAETAEILRTFGDLTNIENGYAAGKPQLDFHMLDHGRSLGLTGNDVGRQLRAGFYGAEALREQRGRNEIKIMVRLPEEQRASEHDLEELLVRTPRGGHVPLSYVAEFERGRAPTVITRESGHRIVNVSGDLRPGAESSREIIEALEESEFPRLYEAYPGLEIELAGQQREQNESLSALLFNYLLALLAIYALLAIPFRSYLQPLVVMSAIPLGLVGAVIGHLLMGYSLSIISLFGIVALSGVVVNDSLVLIDTANTYRSNGQGALEAIGNAAVRRIRPILLTSLTTFFGLMPMIFETSMQARFLIPMAISLGFGILFATFIVLGMVPAFYMIVEDITNFFRAAWAWLWEEVPPPGAEVEQPAK